MKERDGGTKKDNVIYFCRYQLREIKDFDDGTRMGEYGKYYRSLRTKKLPDMWEIMRNREKDK